MKKKELELLLQKVPVFEKPVPKLEQYITTADIAADIIFIAYQFGDIKDKIVVDLGCGTGIFSFGASIAGAKEVVGIDIDKNSIKIAKNYAKKINEKIKFVTKDIKNVKIICDTIIMNPPFGAQKSNLNADRRFIEKGFEISKIIYSLHLSKTIQFINKLVSSLGGEINYSKDYTFSLKNVFNFHKKEILKFNITLLRILTKRF
jgi:putative methylase